MITFDMEKMKEMLQLLGYMWGHEDGGRYVVFTVTIGVGEETSYNLYTPPLAHNEFGSLDDCLAFAQKVHAGGNEEIKQRVLEAKIESEEKKRANAQEQIESLTKELEGLASPAPDIGIEF